MDYLFKKYHEMLVCYDKTNNEENIRRAIFQKV